MRCLATVAVVCGFLIFPVAVSAQTARNNASKPDVVWHGQIETFNRINLPANLRAQEVPTTLVDGPRAFAVDNTVDFAKLWMLVRRPGSLPDVDFSRFTAIVTFIPAYELRIVEVDGQPLLDYRIGNIPGGVVPYTIAIFPRSAVNALLGRSR